MQRGLVRRVGPWGIALATSCVALAARSQAVDIEPASLTAGAPLNVTVRVRPDGTQTAPLPPHCLEAEIVTDGLLLPTGDIRIFTRRDAAAGWTRVRLSHPHRQRGPTALVSLTLKCGSTFERQFSLLTKVGPQERPPGDVDRASIRRPPGNEPRSAKPPLAAEAHTANSAAQAPETPPPQRQQQQLLLAPEISATPAQPDNAARSSNRESLAPHELPGTSGSSGLHARPPVPAADPHKLQTDLARLQAEHQRALSQVATLQSRLTHEELSPSRTTWAALLGLLALSLVQFKRWTSQRRPMPRAAARAFAVHKADAQTVAATTATQAPAQRRLVSADEPHSGTSNITASAPAPGSRWHDADFGRPTLSDAGVRPMLREVELLIEQGYPAAATLTLEQHLMSQEGKHPAVLLSLFDLYGDMGQPWNRERVGAQLEALYNVQGPLNGDDTQRAVQTTPALEDCRASLDRIVRTWSGAEGRSALGSLLLRPAAVEPLPLAAFREAVWLHGLRTELDRPTQPAHDSGELTLEPMATG